LGKKRAEGGGGRRCVISYLSHEGNTRDYSHVRKYLAEGEYGRRGGEESALSRNQTRERGRINGRRRRPLLSCRKRYGEKLRRGGKNDLFLWDDVLGWEQQDFLTGGGGINEGWNIGFITF